MCSLQAISSISFRGGETCGSTSERAPIPNSSLTEGKNSSIAFQARKSGDVYESKKGSTGKKIIAATSAIVFTGAAAIAGLGYMGKKGVVSGMKNATIKKYLAPVVDKCQAWTDAVINFVTRKKP